MQSELSRWVTEQMFPSSNMCLGQGLGEGVTSPAMFAMLARWGAPNERSRSVDFKPWDTFQETLALLSRFTAFTTAGTAFGTVIAMPASTYLCEFLGWESVFYVFGSLGLVWFIIWSLVIHDGPDVHPRSVWLRQKVFVKVF